LPRKDWKLVTLAPSFTLYGDGKALEVEFVALDGHTVAVATVEASDVRPVTASEIPHARELVAA
jgi:hypothetical protein